jgi:hypothetical protein
MQQGGSAYSEFQKTAPTNQPRPLTLITMSDFLVPLEQPAELNGIFTRLIIAILARYRTHSSELGLFSPFLRCVQIYVPEKV